ncbi:MAG TPA: glycosyltransferase family 2 protein [Thermodesulfobacteriota bacterium]|nr:glycosyltransferase family 2 protein [Thermodesulfobacteriota bacterium]
MEKISVAIITKNEGQNIRECLESVKWADEIVVVDNGSTDETLKICGEYRARVFPEDWKGYSDQKNSAIEKTRNEWVLSLDADERIGPELRQEIEGALQGNPSVDGYFIARKNFFLGRWIRHCGWYPDLNLRLFRKSRGRFQERAVHEKVDLQGKSATLKNPLIHETYRSLSDFFQRMDRYSTLAAREMSREGRRCRFIDVLFRPPLTFLQMYVLRAGFLEGYFGFLLSILYSFYNFAKYNKLKELEGNEKLHPRK